MCNLPWHLISLHNSSGSCWLVAVCNLLLNVAAREEIYSCSSTCLLIFCCHVLEPCSLNDLEDVWSLETSLKHPCSEPRAIFTILLLQKQETIYIYYKYTIIQNWTSLVIIDNSHCMFCKPCFIIYNMFCNLSTTKVKVQFWCASKPLTCEATLKIASVIY